MNAIVGFSSLIIDSGLDAGLQKEYATHIQNSTLQLLSIVNDILTVAKLQTGQERLMLRPVFIHEIINMLSDSFLTNATNKQLGFKTEINQQNSKEVITTDVSKLQQILSNIIQNAIKFTHVGSIEVGYHCHQSTVEFFVSDTGIGIPPEAIPYIFDRFRQADPSISVEYGGNGLGLSISQSYANLLGGEIRVESKVGVGTTFYLTIPKHVQEKG